MNILHIIPSLSKGGAERICLDIALELQKRQGIKYLLVLLDDKDEYQFISKKVNKLVTDSRIELKLLGKNRYNLSHLQKVVDEFKPHVIHSHLYLAELYSKHIKSKAIRFCHVHDNMHQLENVSVFNINSKQYLVKYFERNYYDKVANPVQTNFLCISKDAELFVNKHLASNNKRIHFVPNAINIERFAFKEKTKNDDTINLVNIGSFVDKKGQLLLLETVVELKRVSEKKIKLYLIGDGENRVKLETFCREHYIEDEVVFLGKIDNPEEYLQKSDLYTHSASYEPFGLVIIEAMSTGTPVLATDGKGNRDFMTSSNGILLNHRDAQLFAQEINELMRDTERYSSYQKHGLSTAAEYDIKEHVDRLLNLYQNTIDEN